MPPIPDRLGFGCSQYSKIFNLLPGIPGNPKESSRICTTFSLGNPTAIDGFPDFLSKNVVDDPKVFEL